MPAAMRAGTIPFMPYSSPAPIFDHIDSPDAELFAEIARILGANLPEACTSGIAANARLLEQHRRTLDAKPTAKS